ncbi:MAG: alpha/beta hydrolase-fold protein [Bacteroidota bacterium]
MRYLTPLLLLMCVLQTKVNAQEITIGFQDSLYSETLQEMRHLKVFLPPSYEKYTSVKYPVTFLLDGNFLFHSASGMIEYMSKTGELPEMIVIAIANTQRTRDFTPTHTLINYEGEEDQGLKASGGGERFLTFLEAELIPYIQEQYKALPFNTIIGRSFGGLIAGHNYLQANSKINRFLLIDPSFWWDEQWLVEQAKATSVEAIQQKRMYISCSDNFEYSDYIKGMRASQEGFAAQLVAKGLSKSAMQLDYFEEETHGTVTLPSLRNGLLFLFNDFYLDGMKYKTADEILNHFQQFAAANHPAIYPLEGMITWLASKQSAGYPDRAERLYQLNLKHFPESVRAHFALAQHYEKQEDKAAAIALYEAILLIDEDNKVALEKLSLLEKD